MDFLEKGKQIMEWLESSPEKELNGPTEAFATIKAMGVLREKVKGDPAAEEALKVIKFKIATLIQCRRSAITALTASELGDVDSVKIALEALGVQLVDDMDVS